MQNLTKTGRGFFALGMIALAILSICSHSFLFGRPPAWPAMLPGNMVWVVLSCLAILACGAAILLGKNGRPAALLTGWILVVYSILFRYLPEEISSKPEAILWSVNFWKTLAMAGGCFIIAASYTRPPGQASDRLMVSVGTILVSLFLVIAGLSHIKFAAFVKDFIPAYIPGHAFWTWFTAIALLAGGIGLQIRPVRVLAATLSGWMIFAWFILLHIPRLIASPHDPSDQMGICESLAISGILLVLSRIFAGKQAV